MKKLTGNQSVKKLWNVCLLYRIGWWRSEWTEKVACSSSSEARRIAVKRYKSIGLDPRHIFYSTVDEIGTVIFEDEKNESCI
jgi:hypothetical protein